MWPTPLVWGWLLWWAIVLTPTAQPQRTAVVIDFKQAKIRLNTRWKSL